MKEKFSAIQSEVFSRIENNFLPVLNSKIDDQIHFIKVIENEFKRFFNCTEFNDNLINTINCLESFNKIIFEYLEIDNKQKEKINFNSNFGEFSNSLTNYFLEFPDVQNEVQLPERFNHTKGDRLLLRFLKLFKRIFFKISQLPIIFGNIFRKNFNKELKHKRDWQQSVPLKNMLMYELKEELSLKLLETVKETNKKISDSHLKIWRIYETINDTITKLIKKSEYDESGEIKIEKFDFKSETESIINELKNFKSELKNQSKKIFDNEFEEFKLLYDKVDTIEHSAGNFNKSSIENAHNDLDNKFSQLSDGWKNTFFSLSEDWETNCELYLLRDSALSEYFNIEDKIGDYLSHNLIPPAENIMRSLNNLRIDIKRFKGSESDLKKYLHILEIDFSNTLKNSLVPSLNDKILNSNFPSLIDSLENEIRNKIEKISNKRAIVQTSSYDNEIKDSEIEFISPRELISFDTLPLFLENLRRVKNQVTAELQIINEGLNSLTQIYEFNLESAYEILENKSNRVEDAKFIAIEGLDRIIGKTSEIKEQILNINYTISDILKRSIEDFNIQIISLTLNEKVLEIRLRIAKAKAKQKAENYKKEFAKLIKNIFPSLVSFFKNSFTYISRTFINIKEKFGLTSKSTSISAEISDFLAETKLSIETLPYVYKRLFQIEPLTNERFFLGRNKEFEKLENSFKNWKKERFTPTVLVGEKGSGTTSIINLYLKTSDKKLNVKRLVITNTTYNENDFLELLKNLFEIKESNIKLNDIIEKIRNENKKQIVVVENLQNLYIRKINGFNCLKIIFEIISKTNNKIFWLVSVSLYTWEYLNKTLNIGDYFGYVISLEALNDDQINQIILTRHKISGYNIYFEPSENDLESKTFQKLTQEEKQEYLKKEYFSDLNKFAKSNISLSLLYWLRSTNEVTGDTITIGKIHKLDFSFLSGLSTSKILTLNALLTHDGLSVENHSLIFNLTVEQSKLILQLLYDDGIIVKNKEVYVINPILYRQIVNLLQSKNFIH